jgi:hypothetical protein
MKTVIMKYICVGGVREGTILRIVWFFSHLLSLILVDILEYVMVSL